MPSEPYRIKGIILTTRDYKDKDRLLSVLTRDRGVVNCCAKGVSVKNTKLSFVSVPYSYCELVLSDSHGFPYIKEGNVISGNTGIMNSLEAMSVAGHMASCLLESVMQSDNAASCFVLAIYAFYALSQTPSEYLKVFCIFNWKLMWLLGLAGSAATCTAEFKLAPRVVEILDYIGNNKISNIFTIKLESTDIDALRAFTLSYLRIQFEKDIPDPIAKLKLPVVGVEG